MGADPRELVLRIPRRLIVIGGVVVGVCVCIFACFLTVRATGGLGLIPTRTATAEPAPEISPTPSETPQPTATPTDSSTPTPSPNWTETIAARRTDSAASVATNAAEATGTADTLALSATPTPAPTAVPAQPNCHLSYPTVCIPPPPPDLACADIPHRDFLVLPPDPHEFDPDNDGVGCEG